MTQSAFVTEVHNINGKGEDSGVVYSEMQGRENGSGDLMQLRSVLLKDLRRPSAETRSETSLQRSLYSKKNAFRSETGGLMEALRVLKVEESESDCPGEPCICRPLIFCTQSDNTMRHRTFLKI